MTPFAATDGWTVAPRGQTAARAGATAAWVSPRRSGEIYCLRYCSKGMVSAASTAAWSATDWPATASSRACRLPV